MPVFQTVAPRPSSPLKTAANPSGTTSAKITFSGHDGRPIFLTVQGIEIYGQTTSGARTALSAILVRSGGSGGGAFPSQDIYLYNLFQDATSARTVTTAHHQTRGLVAAAYDPSPGVGDVTYEVGIMWEGGANVVSLQITGKVWS